MNAIFTYVVGWLIGFACCVIFIPEITAWQNRHKATEHKP